MINKTKKINRKQKGSLLLELLISMSILIVIILVGTNAIFLSMKSNEASRERDVVTTLANESLEAVQAVAEEDWQNIYSLVKDSQHYYPTLSANKWILTTTLADETLVFNGKNYKRYAIISNTSRDNTTRNIQDVYNSLYNDPSTQKVSVTVTSPEGYTITAYRYFFQWKNKICDQTSWVTPGSSNEVKTCPDTTYDTKDNSINTTGGILKLN